MAHSWIVVADAARARIFSVDGPLAPLQALHQLVSPQAKLHDRDIGSDRPGRVHDSHGQGRHAMGTHNSPKEQDAIRFASEVVDQLEKGRAAEEFNRLILVAEPRFLGLLRKAVKPALEQMITVEIDKDLSKADEDTIRSHLPDRI